MNVPFLDTLQTPSPVVKPLCVVAAIQLAPTLADTFEHYISLRLKKKRETRPTLAKMAIPRLLNAVSNNGPKASKGRHWATSLEAALMEPAPLEALRATFNATVAVEDKLRGLGFDCPLKWELYPSAVWRPEGFQSDLPVEQVKALLADGLKPFRNYFFGVRACWATDDLYTYEGYDDYESTDALDHAQDFVTKMMCHALVGAQP